MVYIKIFELFKSSTQIKCHWNCSYGCVVDDGVLYLIIWFIIINNVLSFEGGNLKVPTTNEQKLVNDKGLWIASQTRSVFY